MSPSTAPFNPTKFFTNPLWGLFLSPTSALLLASILLARTASLAWLDLLLVWFFYFFLYFQELIFIKLQRFSPKQRLSVLLVTNAIMALFVGLIWWQGGYRLGLLSLIVILMNHSYALGAPVADQYYPYHLILNSLAKFGLGNFILFGLHQDLVPLAYLSLFGIYCLFGASCLHQLTLVRQRHWPARRGGIYLLSQILFRLTSLLGLVLLFLQIPSHFSYLGLILLGLICLLPLWQELGPKKHLSISSNASILFAFTCLASLFLAFFYH